MNCPHCGTWSSDLDMGPTRCGCIERKMAEYDRKIEAQKMEAIRPPDLKHQNRDNIHVKRLTRAIVLLTHSAEIHVGGETEEKFRETAKELRKTRDVLELLFDKLDAIKTT